MAGDKDFNDVLEDIFLTEESCHKDSYEDGYKAGSQAGNPEGYHLGYHRGVELGRELGYYLGTVTYYLELNKTSETQYSEKILNQLQRVKELIDEFPRVNSEDQDILTMVECIRAQYKKTCALLKITSTLPYTQIIMESKMKRIHRHIDCITNYLRPLLQFVNCHMVDYFVNDHWERFVPSELRLELEGSELEDTLDVFWNQGLKGCKAQTLLSYFIRTARSHYLTVDSEICLSVDEMKSHIQAMGGEVKKQICIKEFMTAKKSYEVQVMSPLVASLFEATSSTHCVDLGGGAGHLGVVLDLGYKVPSLAVDCDLITMEGGKKRDVLIKKQWQSIAKGADSVSSESGNLHRYCHTYVKNNTNLCQIINEQFGESNENIKILLTGLHTCGNLGSDSLRLFTKMESMSAVFNVPCCYHLLTEVCDENPLWNAFDKTCCVDDIVDGFPMSQYLHGFQLGRNARMLAAQSIDRVLSNNELPSRSLLYRAVLQQIIKKEIPNKKIAVGKLRRVSKTTTNFLEYFREANKILNLELHALTDNYLTDEFDSCQLKWKNMAVFYLLRICLSQVIEALILLDRLLFLYENGFRNAFLVKLFDPAVSPRCHGIFAVS